MLMRIDHDRIRLSDRRVRPPRWLIQRILNQLEISAIGRVHMHPESVLLSQSQDLWQRIHRSHGRRPQGRHHRAHIALAQLIFQRIKAHPRPRIRRHRADSPSFSTLEIRWCV